MALKNHGPGGCCCVAGDLYIGADEYATGFEKVVEYIVEDESFAWDADLQYLAAAPLFKPCVFAAGADGHLFGIATSDGTPSASNLVAVDSTGAADWDTNVGFVLSVQNNRITANQYDGECVITRPGVTAAGKRYDNTGTFDHAYDFDDFDAPEGGATSTGLNAVTQIAVDGGDSVWILSHRGGWYTGAGATITYWPIGEFNEDGTVANLFKRPQMWDDADKADGIVIHHAWGLPTGGIHVLVTRHDTSTYPSGRDYETDLWRFKDNSAQMPQGSLTMTQVFARQGRWKTGEFGADGALILSDRDETPTTVILCGQSGPNVSGDYCLVFELTATTVELRRYDSDNDEQWAKDYTGESMVIQSVFAERDCENLVEIESESLLYYIPYPPGSGAWTLYGLQTSDGSIVLEKAWGATSTYVETGSMIRKYGVPLLGG